MASKDLLVWSTLMRSNGAEYVSQNWNDHIGHWQLAPFVKIRTFPEKIESKWGDSVLRVRNFFECMHNSQGNKFKSIIQSCSKPDHLHSWLQALRQWLQQETGNSSSRLPSANKSSQDWKDDRMNSVELWNVTFISRSALYTYLSIFASISNVPSRNS